MSPGIGAPELIVLLILALVVVGPKDLPLMTRKLGRFIGQAKAMAREFQRNFDELGREAEMEELRKEIDALKNANPVSEVSQELKHAAREATQMRPIPKKTTSQAQTAAPVRDTAGLKAHPRVAQSSSEPVETPVETTDAGSEPAPQSGEDKTA